MRLLPKLLLVAGLVALTVACGDSSRPSGEGSAVQSEAITVHGDWRVAIHNADDSLDREYQFANAMRVGAGDLLGRLLHVNVDSNPPPDGYPRPYSWVLLFGDTDLLAVPPDTGVIPGVSPCTSAIGVPGVPGRNTLLSTGCVLDPVLAPFVEVDGIPLTTTIENGIRLSGSAVATQAGSINYVETWLYLRVGEGSGGFPELEGNAFTGTSVGPFEDILPGQTIQVQVDITFASPAP